MTPDDIRQAIIRSLQEGATSGDLLANLEAMAMAPIAGPIADVDYIRMIKALVKIQAKIARQFVSSGVQSLEGTHPATTVSMVGGKMETLAMDLPLEPTSFTLADIELAEEVEKHRKCKTCNGARFIRIQEPSGHGDFDTYDCPDCNDRRQKL